MNSFYKTLEIKLRSGIGICLDMHSSEEVIVFENLSRVGDNLNIPTITWDLANGFQKIVVSNSGISYEKIYENIDISSFTDAILFLRGLTDPGLFVLLDIFNLLKTDIVLKRQIKCLLDDFSRKSTNKLIIFGQDFQMPDDLLGRMEYYKKTLPNEDEIEQELNSWINSLQETEENTNKYSIEQDIKNKIVLCWKGLTIKEGANIIIQSVIEHDSIDEKVAGKLYEYKVEKLKRLGIEISPPPEEQVGGLGGFKSWFNKRKQFIFQQDNSIPQLKGVLICGIPGTGKSLIAKNIGLELNVPVFKLEASNLLASLVGESEKKTKTILEQIEAAAPGVLLIDEIDKLFGGVGDIDGGSFQRVFGIFLSWLQNHKAKVYTVATANKTNNLPPELLRKGRFDEVFFVDLPTTTERQEIFKIHFEKRFNLKQNELNKYIKHCVENTKEFSGSEIASIIDSLIIEIKANDLELNTFILDNEISKITPLAVSKKKELDDLRAFNNFVSANDKEKETNKTKPFSRKIN